MASLRERGSLGPVGLRIYNLFYWPYLLVSCVVLFFPALLLFLLTFWWDKQRRILHAYTCLWGSHYLAWAPFAGVQVVGNVEIPKTAAIYVSNHQSMVDILAVFALRRPFLWVSKVENFYVPFLGWNMWLNGYVPLRRGYLPSILRMVRTCIRRLGEGHSLFVFPEGTRSPDGTLQPFFPGAFRLAVRNRVPIIPVLLDGTGDILPKHSFGIRPRRVVLQILDPLHPAEFNGDWRRLRDEVKERLELAQSSRASSSAPALSASEPQSLPSVMVDGGTAETRALE